MMRRGGYVRRARDMNVCNTKVENYEGGELFAMREKQASLIQEISND